MNEFYDVSGLDEQAMLIEGCFKTFRTSDLAVDRSLYVTVSGKLYEKTHRFHSLGGDKRVPFFSAGMK